MMHFKNASALPIQTYQRRQVCWIQLLLVLMAWTRPAASAAACDSGSPALRAGCMWPSCKRLRCKHPETKGIASSLFGSKLTKDICTAFLHAEQVKDSCSTAVDPSRGSRASPRKGSLSNRSLLHSSLQTASAETSRAIRAQESNPGGCNCSETELRRKVVCGVTGLTS
jgi:hypothetical protein